MGRAQSASSERFRLAAAVAWLNVRVGPAHRTVDALECVLAVLLAVLFAHAIGAQNVSWAAYSGYMVMRGHVAESLLRGCLRIFGTAAGAALGIIIPPQILSAPPAATLAAATVGGVALYQALTARRAYAWLFVGLTFEMVLFDKLQHPDLAVVDFAAIRLLDVAAGTSACIVVSLLSTLTLRRRWSVPPSARNDPVAWRPDAARRAAQAGVALALLPLLRLWQPTPDLAQGAVTIMAVMLMPLSGIDASGFRPVSRRLMHRVAGCLAGMATAALFLLLAHGRAQVLVAGACLGVAIGRHVENGRSPLTYIGTQFVLAILVTLLPDSYANAEIGPALERLGGIVAGMAILEPVLIAWHLIASRTRLAPNPGADPGHSGG
jgi:uncharacterized membrane protein YccC